MEYGGAYNVNVEKKCATRAIRSNNIVNVAIDHLRFLKSANVHRDCNK